MAMCSTSPRLRRSASESSTGILDQAADFQLEIAEVALGQVLPVVAHGQLAVRPEVGRDVLFRIRLLRHEPVQREQLHGIGDES